MPHVQPIKTEEEGIGRVVGKLGIWLIGPCKANYFSNIVFKLQQVLTPFCLEVSDVSDGYKEQIMKETNAEITKIARDMTKWIEKRLVSLKLALIVCTP
jgi:hypothetical protein